LGVLSGTIVDHYYDIFGNPCPIDSATRQALLAAMHVSSEEELTSDDVIVSRGDHDYEMDAPGDVTLEDGTELRQVKTLSRDLPLGYHQCDFIDGRKALIIKAPERCHLDPQMRIWAWAIQLYSLRSPSSCGQGDLSDLKRFSSWSASKGCGAILVNPIHAVAPVGPQQASPYFPSSRRFLSPLYLDVTRVPGFHEIGDTARKYSSACQELNELPAIDRGRVWQVKRDTLEVLFRNWGGGSGFDAFREQQGDSLAVFATFSTLAEKHGPDWREWPDEYRSPASHQVTVFQRENNERISFFCWLQWLLDEQLRDAAAETPIVQDLPIGVDPGGADAWQWQDVLALDVTVGAPPDHFNTNGQDWGLPPFIPHRLRAAGYQPFIETLRASLRHAGGLRVDHVMGLFRLFWIPDGQSPAAGAYVRYPADELLAIVALESHRASAWIAGEDLGTVEMGVREKLYENAMLCYRLLWFQDELPQHYPELSMAAITTHDLPTIAGLWTGDDLAYQHSLGLAADPNTYDEMKRRMLNASGVAHDADLREALVATHRSLAKAPSVVAVANLDDALAIRQRPNVPGTVTERANWSHILPKSIDELTEDPLVNEVTAAMNDR
jgi:4-alpha-glucanotransferase